MMYLIFKSICVICYTFLLYTGKITVADTWAVPMLLILF